MLVLMRKTNERIEIGDDMEVVVLSIQGNRVRLGITAPTAIRISRSAPLACWPEAGQPCELEVELACGVG